MSEEKTKTTTKIEKARELKAIGDAVGAVANPAIAIADATRQGLNNVSEVK